MSGVSLGYFSLTVDELIVQFVEAKQIPKSIKVEYEIISNLEKFGSWSSSDSAKHTFADLVPHVEDAKMTLGNFSLQRSKYIDLISSNINKLANSYVAIKVLDASEDAAAQAPAAAKKGKDAPAPTAPKENALIEIFIHLSELIKSRQGVIEINSSIEELSSTLRVSTVPATVPTSSAIQARLALDNEFAEYVAGCKILQWEFASLTNLGLAWGIAPVEVVEKGKGGGGGGKGKTGPTPQEKRNKYLADLKSTLESQSEIVSYNLSIDPTFADFSEAEGTIDLSQVNLSMGRLEYNFAAANDTIDPEIDLSIDKENRLWSVSWGPSSLYFLNRKEASVFTKAIQNASKNLEYGVTITKKKGPANQDASFSEMTLQGKIVINDLVSPDKSGFAFPVEFGEGEEGMVVDAKATISLNVSSPLLDDWSIPPSESNPVDVISLQQVSSGAQNRDVRKELHQEMSSIIKEIAQEYVTLYPASIKSKEKDASTENRKAHFMHYLSISGIYHRIKERIKPKIQRYARERYSARSRALGKGAGSATTSLVPSEGYANEADVPLDEMISELFVTLVKDCNTVLNGMYKDTIIKLDAEELGKGPAIDDEVETPRQKFYRLYQLARDTEDDKRYYQADQYHLERIQLLDVELSLKTDLRAPHHAYFQYHEFLLRRAVTTILGNIMSNEDRENVASSDVNPNNPRGTSEDPLSFPREVLRRAIECDKTDWISQLQFGCLLMEEQQIERAGEYLKEAVNLQLNSSSLKNLEALQGYESDTLCPVHPICYVMLSVYYHLMEKPLLSRKSIRLAVRSFEEGNFQPPVSTHGKPRRTAVLSLAEGANYLFEHGMYQCGNIALQFAVDCDMAATKKAEERGFASDTVPAIRHQLKKAQTFSELYMGNISSAYQLARDSVIVSTSVNDMIQGWLLVLKVLQNSDNERNTGSQEIISACSQMIKCCQSMSTPDYKLIPLWAYNYGGKVLLSQNKYSEGLDFMLYGCSVHPSSSLFHMVGICCLRLGRLVDAEDAFQEANLLDNRNPEVWAFLSILCLETGQGRRTEEAEKSLFQALRLGLTNVTILRELATSYLAVDKLSIAEDLLRRALATESGSTVESPMASKSGSAITRRMLGDVLAGQNMKAQAVDEYRVVLEDMSLPTQERLETASKCVELLNSLGRYEEVNILNQIIHNSLSNQEQVL